MRRASSRKPTWSVPARGRLRRTFLGLLTFDDALELIEAADSEDIARQAGSQPITGHYATVGVLRLARARAVWLLLLIIASTLTINVMQGFEATLEQVTALALFVPMLTGTGGNVGSQSATAVVRALAVGEVRLRDLPRVIWKESRVGLLLGCMLATIALIIGSLLVGTAVAAAVALSVVAIALGRRSSAAPCRSWPAGSGWTPR